MNVMQMLDVLSYGTIGLDRTLQLPHWPSPDISTHTHKMSEHLGGKAANVAILLCSWGIRTALSGTKLGTDAVGKQVLGMLGSQKRLDTSMVETQEYHDSMYCLILVNPGGERSIIGVNTDTQRYTAPSAEMVGRCKYVTVDLYGGEERVEVGRIAYEQRRPVIVGDLRRVDHPIVPYSTITISSGPELRNEYPTANLQDVAVEIVRQGPTIAIVTDGPNLVTVATADKQLYQFMPPQVRAIDCTGAGDAFRAGIVYGRVKGFNISDCIRFGIASGSLTVERLGASSEPPSLAEVEFLARKIRTT